MGFIIPDVPAHTYHYSPDGRLFAYALPTVYVCGSFWLKAHSCFKNWAFQISSKLIELRFSPCGAYLSTWERPVKLEDGAQHKNLCVFSASTSEELISFTQKSQENWDLQYTMSESRVIRFVAREVQGYRPAGWGKSIVDQLRIEGASMVSLTRRPRLNLSVVSSQSAPAIVKIYGLSTLSGSPTCSKTFYKADALVFYRTCT
ncbi:hypothetical protein F4604DRAFT_1919135 [Suillus subluteus]|nr:hypothetical protein F4604DRAFT_1919135 [Suillus subluteus]